MKPIILAGTAGMAGAVVTLPLRGMQQLHSLESLHQVHIRPPHQHLSFAQEDNTTLYIVLGVVGGVLLLALIGGAAFGIYRHMQNSKEQGEKEAPLVEGEAAASAAAPVVIDESETATHYTKGQRVDLERFLQLAARRAVHQVGPKLTKAANVRQVIVNHVYGFKSRAMSFLGSELMATVAQLLKEAGAEEVMVLLDPQESMASNLPPLSVLLAGLLSPVVLAISLVIHLSQIFMVLSPSC